MVKAILLVLDGVADDPSLGKTSLELANIPHLDELARRSIGGGFHPIAPGIAPESDAAVLSMLGYDPSKYVVGRGIIEAFGAGLSIVEGREVAFRANFATIDPGTRRLIDRRVGRSLSTEEARKLAKALDGMELGIHDGYVRFVATVGHRAVAIVGSRSRRLSADVSNVDPAYERRGRLSVAVKSYEPYLPRCRPLVDTEEARATAELVNAFIDKAIEILDKHPVNEERARKGLLKANAVLLRDAEDRIPRLPPISQLYQGLRFGAVAEMPVEKGLARLLSMDVAEVPPPTPDKAKDYPQRLEKTLELLERVDIVYVHLKGPDEPGHDGDKQRKVRSIELIDQYFVKPLLDRIDLREVAVIVTADHATPPELKAHSGTPVPLIVAYEGLPRRDGLSRFTERECFEKGSLGVMQHGYEMLPKVLKLIGLLR